MVNKKFTCISLIFAVIVFIDVFAGKILLWQGIPSGDSHLRTLNLINSKYEAKRGSVDAAKKLIWFYSDYKNDINQAKKWELVAAHNGDAYYQYLQGRMLIEQGKGHEGRKWLNKASKNGSIKAQKLLDEANLGR